MIDDVMTEAIRAAAQRTEVGAVGAGRDQSTWNLLEGEGLRTTVLGVSFARPFRTPPAVMAALNHVDVLNNANWRLSTNVRNVTPLGFEVEFSTWADTHVWSASVTWIAIGA